LLKSPITNGYPGNYSLCFQLSQITLSYLHKTKFLISFNSDDMLLIILTGYYACLNLLPEAILANLLDLKILLTEHD